MSHEITTKAQLEQFICQNWDAVNSWIDDAQSKLPQPLTSSVDIRESNRKFAPVDHNMYPAGFNNLCSKDLINCATEFARALKAVLPKISSVGLIPESHTKNKYYLDHLHHLKSTIEAGGIAVTLISPDPQLFAEADAPKVSLESFSGHTLEIHEVRNLNGDFEAPGIGPELLLDLIILNNDQSVLLPVDWKTLKLPVLPSPSAGWYRRQKITHFSHYRRVAHAFAEHFRIDPNLIQAKYSSVDGVDFSTKDGLEGLAQEVERLLGELPPESSLFVKASQGTYGMGISVVSSGEEIRSMNRKVRNKMDVGKSNLKFTSVLIQEGVETMLRYDDAPAEVTIYLIDGRSCGGFMRTNPLKGSQANLNSQGMVYRKFCISEIRQDHDHQIKEAVYSVIARLSTLAAAHEIKEMESL